MNGNVNNSNYENARMMTKIIISLIGIIVIGVSTILKNNGGVNDGSKC